MGEAHNLITDAGKEHILRYLAGQESQLAGAIAVGIGEQAAAGTDTKLALEVARGGVTLSSPNSTGKITFKSFIDDDREIKIYECGLFSDNVISGDDTTLFTFSASDEYDWTNAAIQTSNSRYGGSSLYVNATGGSTKTASTEDPGFSLSDLTDGNYTLAVSGLSTNVAQSSIKLIGTDSTSVTLNFTLGASYSTALVAVSQSQLATIRSWDEISKVEFKMTSTASAGSLYVDLVTLRNDISDISDTLVSRSVLSTPITKKPGVGFEVEYNLDVSI